MCSNHSAHYHAKRRHSRKHWGSPRYRFFRNLRAYVIFNIVMVALMLSGGGFIGLWKVSMIWGAVLFIKYVRLYGWPGANGWFSDDWKEWMHEREHRRRNEAEPLDPKDPGWRDRDLV